MPVFVWLGCSFKNQHNLVKRARTQVAQKLPEDFPLVVMDFFKKACEKTMGIKKKFIISFDETPMWFDMPRGSTLEFQGTREVPIKTTGSDKVRFTIVLGYTASGDKLLPTVIFKLKKKPRGKFPRDIVVTTAPYTNIIGDLMISTYISQVIWARPNGFFKNKGVVFVDRHRSYVRDDVVRALNNEGLDVLEIPGGTTSVLQLPDVSINKPFKSGMRKRWEEWMENGKKEFTAKGNRKKASYELVSEWVSQTWKEISKSILVKSFESTGLTLNPDGSEDHKVSHRLQAIIENRITDIDRDELLNEESVHSEEEVDDDEENENVMDMDMSNIDIDNMDIDDIDDNMLYGENSVNDEDEFMLDNYMTDNECYGNYLHIITLIYYFSVHRIYSKLLE